MMRTGLSQRPNKNNNNNKKKKKKPKKGQQPLTKASSSQALKTSSSLPHDHDDDDDDHNDEEIDHGPEVMFRGWRPVPVPAPNDDELQAWVTQDSTRGTSSTPPPSTRRRRRRHHQDDTPEEDNDMAMFYRLEVLEGHQYHVETVPGSHEKDGPRRLVLHTATSLPATLDPSAAAPPKKIKKKSSKDQNPTDAFHGSTIPAETDGKIQKRKRPNVTTNRHDEEEVKHPPPPRQEGKEGEVDRQEQMGSSSQRSTRSGKTLQDTATDRPSSPKKAKRSSADSAPRHHPTTSKGPAAPSTDPSMTKKKQKKQKSLTNPITTENDDDDDDDDGGGGGGGATQDQEDDDDYAMQTAWCAATGGVMLHTSLCRALRQQSFWMPTPIQAATLPAALLGRRHVVGAAPTGSGKTLAYLLPMLQTYLTEPKRTTANPRHQDEHDQEEENNIDGDDDEDGQPGGRTSPLPLQGLIVAPTRELALQIRAEAEKLMPRCMGALVGGLAQAKQARVLHKNRPPFLVATPGRLWELMSSRDYSHLNDLSQVRFLVIDEADRMVQQGSFPQLVNILDAIHQANPMDDDDDEEDDRDENLDAADLDGMMNDESGADRLLPLPGVPGEARVQMLTDEILERIRAQQQSMDHLGEEKEEPSDELPIQTEDETALAEVENDVFFDQEAEEDISIPDLPPVFRQTFVYSATLTLPATSTFVKNRSKASSSNMDVDGAIAEILEKAHVKGKIKIVDLTNAEKAPLKAEKTKQKSKKEKQLSSKSENGFRLPPGLVLHQIKCTQLHKDSHLYAFLMTTKQGKSGPCLVFCNSIAAVKRVGLTLQTLRLPVRMLHAQMQQRARLKVVESLRKTKGLQVVVATDVAARGLDIPSVSTVVHYDAARTIDTFVHRSGRTARGVGENAVGSSLSLISSGDDKFYSQLAKKLDVKFEPVPIDGRLLANAQERVNLASKIVAADQIQQRSHRNNQWVQQQAEDAGLEVDEDMYDAGLAGGDQRDLCRLHEAKNARGRLAQLLAEPMRAQRFGKFLLSTQQAQITDLANSKPTPR